MSQSNSAQLSFALHTYTRDSFFVGEANREAVAQIDKYPAWETPSLIIIGPEASGKTHLAEILKSKDNTVQIFENIDENLDEDALFNALNNYERKTLITSHIPPSRLHIKTKDLQSRLSSQVCVKINVPDDVLIRAILIKQLSEFGITIEKKALSYIVNNAERSFLSIKRVAERIKTEIQNGAKSVSVPLIKEILTK